MNILLLSQRASLCKKKCIALYSSCSIIDVTFDLLHHVFKHILHSNYIANLSIPIQLKKQFRSTHKIYNLQISTLKLQRQFKTNNFLTFT